MPCLFPLFCAFVLPLVAGSLLFLSLLNHLPKALLDIPCGRSLHDRPVPRLGGLCIWFGVLIAWGFVQKGPHAFGFLFYACLLSLIVISFLDDLLRLSPVVRLVVHILVSAFWLYGTLSVQVSWPFLIFLLFCLVWMTNLFNFMDGSDGLAGAMAFWGFGFYGFAAWLAGDMEFACINWVVSLASLAFLFYNFPPARMFMGDSGSIPLGFLAGAFGVLGWDAGLWPWPFPVLVFSFFIVDATITLIKRLLHGERIWHAHCNHYYQRLVKLKNGVHGHRHVLKIGCITMFLSGISGIFGIYYINFYIWFLAWSVWYLYFFIKIDKNMEGVR